MSKEKIKKLTTILNNHDLDALALVPGSNFKYITGGDFALMERPTLFILSKINNIAYKNRVLLNPSFNIVDCRNIKNIKLKIKKIYLRKKNEN